MAANLTSSPCSVARSSFCRGTNRTPDVSLDQREVVALERLVGEEGTVTGGEMGIFDEETEEETCPPVLVVKEVIGMEVEGGGGAAVVVVRELLSPLENAASPPLTHLPRGDTTRGWYRWVLSLAADR